MPRIVKEYDERRVDFLEATKLFFFTVGYEKMSVQKLTEQVGVAKGTFYHYFRSKEDLLSQWVIHEMSPIIERHYKVADDQDMDAITKLRIILKNDRDWTLEHLDLMMAILKVMYADDNIRLRAELTRQSSILSQPILEKVIIQGVREGSFNTEFPKEVSRKLPKLFDLFTEDLAQVILDQQHGKDIQYVEALQIVQVWQEVIERVLGATSKSIVFIDEVLLKKMLNQIKKQPLASAIITKQSSLQTI